MRRRLIVAAAAALAAAGAAPIAEAATAVTVVGQSRAGACYEEALRGAADLLALAECDGALEQGLLRHERAATLVNRGVIHLRRKAADLAERDFRAALAVRPDLAAARANLGAARLLAGDFEGAIGHISQAIAEGAPDPHEAHFNRALAFERLERYAEARADYEAALALKPDWSAPRDELRRFSTSRAGG